MTIGCLTAGLDPALGFVHADYPRPRLARPRPDGSSMSAGRRIRARPDRKPCLPRSRLPRNTQRRLLRPRPAHTPTRRHHTTVGNARRTRDRTGRPHAHQHYAAVGRTATTPLTGQNRLDGREPPDASRTNNNRQSRPSKPHPANAAATRSRAQDAPTATSTSPTTNASTTRRRSTAQDCARSRPPNSAATTRGTATPQRHAERRRTFNASAKPGNGTTATASSPTSPPSSGRSSR